MIAPILKPAYASLGIMQFVNMWNEFMQALIILRDEDLLYAAAAAAFHGIRPGNGLRSNDVGQYVRSAAAADLLPVRFQVLYGWIDGRSGERVK